MEETKKGGYDCKFIDDDKCKEFICPVCTLVARDPHQANCCGQIYCKSCIQQLKNSSNNFTCPTCRSDLTNNHFSDTRAHLRMKSLQVYCDIEKDGCQWKGDLKDIEGHLKECPYQLVSCSNDCGMDRLQRRHLQNHLENDCPKRLIKCQYCNEEGRHQVITGDHLGVCPEYPIRCTNEGCGKKVLLRQMPSHKESCPKEMISCEYRSVGCEEKMKREEQEEHNEQWREQHLQLAIGEVKKLHSDIVHLQKEHKSDVDKLQSTIDDLQRSHQSAVSDIKKLQVTNGSLQIELKTLKEKKMKFSGFANKRSNDTPWYSPGFYTSPGGYKMSLCVYANGTSDGKGTHVSCFIYLISGEYDDILEWPFHGEVTIELLNQLEDKNHYKYLVSFNESTPQEYKSQVTGNGRRGLGWGNRQFISHSRLSVNPSLNCQYLKDDTLYFRVSVDIASNNTKPWLATITKIPKLN